MWVRAEPRIACPGRFQAQLAVDRAGPHASRRVWRINGRLVPAAGTGQSREITPCSDDEGIVIHTSHKLEGLGNEFILAFRHFGGILGAARTWTLIAVCSEGGCAEAGRGSSTVAAVRSLSVRQRLRKAKRSGGFWLAEPWEQGGVRWVCLGCKAQAAAELRFSGNRPSDSRDPAL